MDFKWPSELWDLLRRRPWQTIGGIIVLILVGVFVQYSASFVQEKGRQAASVEEGEEDAAEVVLRPGTILATHYPSGELFAFDSNSGSAWSRLSPIG